MGPIRFGMIRIAPAASRGSPQATRPGRRPMLIAYTRPDWQFPRVGRTLGFPCPGVLSVGRAGLSAAIRLAEQLFGNPSLFRASFLD